MDELLPESALQGDWSPGHRLDMALKELEEVRRLADGQEVALTVLEPVLQHFRDANERGWEALSAHAVLKQIEQQAGVRLRTEVDRED
jgi:3-hydroxyisobutyrate dehydrogenase-like beta-hydroxyacid dehydrogenase